MEARSEDLNFSDVIANDIAGVTPEVTDIKVIKSDNTGLQLVTHI